MSYNVNHYTQPQRESLGHQARMASTVRGHKAVHRTPRGDIWDPLPDGQYLAVRRGVIVNAPFTLPPDMQAKEDRVERRRERSARARREKGYGKAIAKQARELAVAAGPAHVDPALVVQHTPALQRVITRLSEDVARKRVPVSHIDKRCIQFGVQHARNLERLEEDKAKAAQLSSRNGRTRKTGGSSHHRVRTSSTASSSHVHPDTSSTAPPPPPPPPAAPSLFENIISFFVGKRKRTAEDDVEARPTKRRVVAECAGAGRDVVDSSARLPGSYEPRRTAVPAQLPLTQRPIAGTSRVEKKAKTVGFASALPRTESGHAWIPKQNATTPSPVTVDLSSIERAAARLDDELIFYMIDQILNH